MITAVLQDINYQYIMKSVLQRSTGGHRILNSLGVSLTPVCLVDQVCHCSTVILMGLRNKTVS